VTARRLPWLLLLALLAPAQSAGAAGPPLPSSYSGRAGAVAPGGTERLVTRRAGDDTVVMAVSRSDRTVLRSRRVSGRWSIPAVTLDGATTGLSADGGTLVVARPAHDFPPPDTRLAVLDARRLEIERTIALPGFLTVDAISPDGGWIYLIQYSEDVLDYRVRALDTRTGRFAAHDVVDPRAPDEQMGGLPMTRAMSRDGRWAYTLYSGGDETFIHALDTVGQTAACIDLDMLPPDADLSNLGLTIGPHGRHVSVRDGGRLVATVDTRTFAVTEPGETPAPAAPPAPRPADDPPAATTGPDWSMLGIAGAIAALAALAIAAARSRRRTVSRN
jgi:hypothetical protein